MPQSDSESDPSTIADRGSAVAPVATAAPQDAKASPRPFGRLRLTLGLTLVGAITLFSLPGTVQVYRDTLGRPQSPSRFLSCEDGLQSLYAGFSRKLSALDLEGEQPRPRRPAADAASRADLAALDQAFRALESVCAREGSEARAAWSSLERWRHRTEDNARLLEQNVTPDAERALRYHSPRR